MKTILNVTACAACAVWAGVAASAGAETVKGQNLVGLTAVRDARAHLPLAAAYGKTGAANPTVADVVQTATLDAGDELYVYDADAKTYRVYALDAAKTWQAQKTVEVTAAGATAATPPAPDAQEVARGRGFWLVRKGEDRSRPVYLVGQVEASAATVEIPAGSAAAPSATLVGVPVDWTLNASDWSGKAVRKDAIRVLNADGAAWREIVFDGEKWVEGVQKKDEATGTVTFEENANPVLAGGLAVWYMRAGETAFTLALPR